MAQDSVVIGFGHRARSGKDTAVAEIIKQRGMKMPSGEMHEGTPDSFIGRGSGYNGFDIRKYSFADALCAEVTAAMLSAGGMDKLFKTDLFVQKNGNFVTLPQWVLDGYEVNPEVNELYPFGKQRTLLQWWGTEYRRSIDPNYWVKQLAERIEKENPAYALIADMRFPNEMAYVKQHGFAVLVDRPGLPPSTHASETALDNVEGWDYILDNSGSLEKLLEGAVTLFDDIAVSFPYGFGV
jgi:hypothetical protein